MSRSWPRGRRPPAIRPGAARAPATARRPPRAAAAARRPAAARGPAAPALPGSRWALSSREPSGAQHLWDEQPLGLAQRLAGEHRKRRVEQLDIRVDERGHGLADERQTRAGRAPEALVLAKHHDLRPSGPPAASELGTVVRGARVDHHELGVRQVALERVEQPRELRRGVVEHGHEREAGAGPARARAAAEQERVGGAHRRYAQVALGTSAGRGAGRRALQDAPSGRAPRPPRRRAGTGGRSPDRRARRGHTSRGPPPAPRSRAPRPRPSRRARARRSGGGRRPRQAGARDRPRGRRSSTRSRRSGRSARRRSSASRRSPSAPSGSPATVRRSSGSSRAASATASSARSGRFQGSIAPSSSTRCSSAGAERRPETLEVDPGVDHAQPLTELGARVEVAGDALRRHHDQLGLARAAPQRASDQRAGQQVVVLEDEPGAGRRRGERGQAGAHAPRHDRVRAQRAEDRAQLGGLSREPAQRGRALSGAATQLEAALAQLEHPDPAFACGVCERSRRAGDQRRLLEPRGDLEQNALGAAEQAGVADCDRRHAGAS